MRERKTMSHPRCEILADRRTGHRPSYRRRNVGMLSGSETFWWTEQSWPAKSESSFSTGLRLRQENREIIGKTVRIRCGAAAVIGQALEYPCHWANTGKVPAREGNSRTATSRKPEDLPVEFCSGASASSDRAGRISFFSSPH